MLFWLVMFGIFFRNDLPEWPGLIYLASFQHGNALPALNTIQNWYLHLNLCDVEFWSKTLWCFFITAAYWYSNYSFARDVYGRHSMYWNMVTIHSKLLKTHARTYMRFDFIVPGIILLGLHHNPESFILHIYINIHDMTQNV